MNPLSLRRDQAQILDQGMQYPRGYRHLNSLLQEPETRATFLAQGYDLAGGSPEDFHRVLGGRSDNLESRYPRSGYKIRVKISGQTSLTVVRNRLLSPVLP